MTKAILLAVVAAVLAASAHARPEGLPVIEYGVMSPLCMNKLRNEQERYKCYAKTIQRVYEGLYEVKLNDLVSSASVFMYWMEPDVFGRSSAGAFNGVDMNAEYLAVAFPALELVGDRADPPELNVFTSFGHVAVFSCDYMRYNTRGTNATWTLNGFAKFHPETNRMTDYDVDFRRYLELLNALGTFRPTPEAQLAFQTYIASVVCNVTMRVCTGSLQQYESVPACVEYLKVRPFIPARGAIAADCGICRVVHTILLPFDLSTHCPHVGPTGGGACTDKPYDEYYSFFPDLVFVAKKSLMR